MQGNIIAQRPAEPPGRFVCWLVAMVEVAACLTISVGVLTEADSSDHGLREVASVDRPDKLVSQHPVGDLEPLQLDPAASDPDAAFAKQMLGTWEDDYEGHRILTLRPDGTGTMIVELKGFAATIFATKLTFEEKWSIENGRVTMKATGGEPAVKVRLVLSIHGDSSTQRIVEVTDDRMILVEEPSGTRFEWRRVRDIVQQEL
jgi:hypothetical protein